MSTKLGTAVGNFWIVLTNTINGEIIVMTDGPALRKKISVIVDAADGDNRITSITRQMDKLKRVIPAETFVITVEVAYRSHPDMNAIFIQLIASVNQTLAEQEDLADQINYTVPARLLEETLQSGGASMHRD